VAIADVNGSCAGETKTASCCPSKSRRGREVAVIERNCGPLPEGGPDQAGMIPRCRQFVPLDCGGYEFRIGSTDPDELRYADQHLDQSGGRERWRGQVNSADPVPFGTVASRELPTTFTSSIWGR
jgi:hypothetical protein